MPFQMILGEVSAVTTSDFQSVFDALTSQLSVTTIVSVLGIGAGVAVGFAFMWWGVRKLTSMLMSAVKKGRVNM